MIEIPSHYLTDTERDVFDIAGYGKRQGLGKAPLLLVVDMTYNFVGESSKPILDAARERRGSCGEYGWNAMPDIKAVIQAFRQKNLPIAYTRISDQDFSLNNSGFGSKNHRATDDKERQISLEGNLIVADIAPEPGEIVIDKQKPSAFFGTPLQSYMVSGGIDSIVLVGCTTSGCVRATAVDAFSLSYRVTVVSSGVFDRFELSHYASLFDLDCKYADVITADQLINNLPAQ